MLLLVILSLGICGCSREDSSRIKVAVILKIKDGKFTWFANAKP